MFRYIKRFTLLTAIVMLMTACGSAPTIDQADTAASDQAEINQQAEDVGLRLPPRATSEQTKKSASAVDQLLVQAHSAIAQDALEKASALVERAIRLAPQDARAYFSLAQVRYQQGQKGQAESLAKKARALVVNDSSLSGAIAQFQKAFTY
ncbi:MAG: tetratricopeptide repeat protein [Pseudomonadales bacterium]|nr:tetratricopeptide repeat protein [Pseudomonadales bacterium]